MPRAAWTRANQAVGFTAAEGGIEAKDRGNRSTLATHSAADVPQ
jgi:hypothetical protein